MKLPLLLSKGFLLGLFILIINDFLLKGIFGNWITGKLSDFTGIFIFPIFITALFPKTLRFNYIFTVLFFIFWKTEASQPFINLLNVLGFPATRVIDYTDFIAFAVLPFSYLYVKRIQQIPMPFNYQKPLAYLMGITAFAAFTATSQIRKMGYSERPQYYVDRSFKSKLPKAALLDSIRVLSTRLYYDTARLTAISDTLYIAEFYDTARINKNTDALRIEEVQFTLEKRRRGSKIHLLTVFTNNYTDTVYDEGLKKAREMAKKLMIEPLH